MTSSQCLRCKHYIFDIKCKAFPKKIPDEIITGMFKHDKKYKGQKNNILFEKVK